MKLCTQFLKLRFLPHCASITKRIQYSLCRNIIVFFFWKLYVAHKCIVWTKCIILFKRVYKSRKSDHQLRHVCLTVRPSVHMEQLGSHWTDFLEIWYLIWYDIIWYDMIWYYIIWYDIWYDMIWCDMIWYDMVWYDVMWCDMIWYDMIWCDMIWYDMVWYDVMWCDMIWYMIRYCMIWCDIW